MRTVLSPRRSWWGGGVKPIEGQGSRQLGLEGQRFLSLTLRAASAQVDHSLERRTGGREVGK